MITLTGIEAVNWCLDQTTQHTAAPWTGRRSDHVSHCRCGSGLQETPASAPWSTKDAELP